MLRHALTAGVRRLPVLPATGRVIQHATATLRPAAALRAYRTSAFVRTGVRKNFNMEDVSAKLSMSLDDIVSRNSRRRPQMHTYAGDDEMPAAEPSSQQPEDDRIPRRVFVNNLSFDTQWQGLKDHFKQVGNVRYAEVIRERDNPTRSKGCGLVEFDTPEDAQRAIAEMNESELDGRNIFVRQDGGRKPRAEGDDRGQKRYRDDEGGFDRQPRERRMRREPNPDIAGRQILLFGLPWRMQWQDLKDLVNDETGGAVRAEIITDRNTGRSRGFGKVLFETEDDADRAVSVLNGLEFDGRYLTAKLDEMV